MPNEIVNIYNGTAQPNQINTTFGFSGGSFLVLNYVGSSQLEIDISLVTFITPDITRAIRLENDNILNTESITILPIELLQSPYNKQLLFTVSEQVQITIDVIKTECCGEAQLNDIKAKVNQIQLVQSLSLAGEALSLAAQGFLLLAVPELLPLLAPNLLRKGFSAILPSGAAGGARILFDNIPKAVLQPAQFFVDDSIPPFTGAISVEPLTVPTEINYKEIV